MKTRTITMTIYKIESHLLDVTTPKDLPDSRFLPGITTVRAVGGGEFHEWRIDPLTQRCWIGDRIDVTVLDLEPHHPPSTPLTPPPLDKR